MVNRVSILRNIRIQLKTGFMREIPSSYDIIRRVPQLNGARTPEYLQFQKKKIPYSHLYEKVLERNPKHWDEGVYAAYANTETTEALAIAKMQYQYIQDGFSEDDAYEKAVKYVNSIENLSFKELKKVLDILKAQGARAPVLHHNNIVVGQQLAAWQAHLAETPYEGLSLIEQGELDKFTQIYILGWNEIQRERRMKDPVFVTYFEKVRKELYPPSPELQKQMDTAFEEEYKRRLLTLASLNPDKMTTTKPFYIEDYIYYYNALREKPNYHVDWKFEDKERFEQWFADTLLYQSILESEDLRAINQYTESTRASFFPMLAFPKRIASLPSLSMDSVKALLYQNEIGYKKDEGKTFVKRFYRLPYLLFPREVFCNNLSLRKDLLKLALSDTNVLKEQIKEAGLDIAQLYDIQKQLEELQFGENYNAQRNHSSKTEDDMAILDDILSTVQQDSKKNNDLLPPIEDYIKELREKNLISSPSRSSQYLAGENVDETEEEQKPKVRPENWNELLKIHGVLPENELEEERLKWWSQSEFAKLDELYTEDDIRAYKVER
jgi:hypothetical protein